MTAATHRALYEEVRQAADERTWGAAVKLARDGVVEAVREDADEIALRVKTRGRPISNEIFLWPGDLEWGCDCDLGVDPCVHVCAAVIAMSQSDTPAPVGVAAAAPRKEIRVRLVYAFQTVDGNALKVHRHIRRPDGSTAPLGLLVDSQVQASPADARVEALLTRQPDGPLTPEVLRRVLALLPSDAQVTLDDQPIRVVDEVVSFRVRVSDDGEGFRAALVRPQGIDALFRGAARIGDCLRPTSHGELLPEQRKLLTKGVRFEPAEVGRLVGDYLPRLRERIEVVVDTERLPTAGALDPIIRLTLGEREGGLMVKADLVYGDPAVAIIEAGNLKAIGKIVPARDLSRERTAVQRFEQKVGLPVGYAHVLPPERAAAFLRDRLPLHEGPIEGSASPARFRVVEATIAPQISVRTEGDAWGLEVQFIGEGVSADPRTVLAAWSSGRSLVPLLDGGYAPLPADWLAKHGGLLREILEARDPNGRVDRRATAALVELLEEARGEVPPDLQRLRRFLEGDENIPTGPLPKGFDGKLRPYQEAGVRWLRFLRAVDLSGVLADDMGLGKTIQALAAMVDAKGKHLVIAPTSVLQNWAREAQRFAPNLRVCIYHGPQRKIDERAHVVLTSYALLRLDVQELKSREWTYVVLDEAQAIKNPDSQTARSARELRARHRLCLTGTPIENRLEELWSLFRFLMPGFLGSLDAFRERFARPIENGDAKARDALRRRVRPYILRRLKQQVATELPPLTDVVVRCEMTTRQREIYDTVRAAARDDVQQAISHQGVGRSALQILEALLRMRQACCDPTLLPGDVGEGAGSGKLDRLEEILVEIVCEDHKALIFSQWTSLLDRVEERLQKLGIAWLRLDGSTRDRQAVIDAFQSPEGPPVFLLSLKAGGTGLNLTAADYVVHLDPWWNPAVQQQATDRAHRIGQSRPVVSYRLVAETSVEERILDLQDAKRALADAAIGDEGGFLKSLDIEELRALFDGA